MVTLYMIEYLLDYNVTYTRVMCGYLVTEIDEALFIYLFILSMQHPLVSSTCHSRLFNGVLKCHYIFSGRHRVGKQFYFLLNTKLNVCDARTDIIQIIFFSSCLLLLSFPFKEHSH